MAKHLGFFSLPILLSAIRHIVNQRNQQIMEAK